MAQVELAMRVYFNQQERKVVLEMELVGTGQKVKKVRRLRENEGFMDAVDEIATGMRGNKSLAAYADDFAREALAAYISQVAC